LISVSALMATIASVGMGRSERATETFQRLQALAPKLVDARLSGQWLGASPDYLRRAHMFFRVAAGLAPRDAADALR